MSITDSSVKAKNIIVITLLAIVILLVVSCLALYFYVNQFLCLKIDTPEEVFYTGNSYQLTCSSSKPIKSWKCSSPEIAMVDNHGILTAISPGQVDITISNGLRSASILVVIQEHPVQVQFHELKVTLNNKLQILEDASQYRWTSSAPEIASMTDTGYLFARNLGSAELTATADNIVHHYQVEVISGPAKNCFYAYASLPITIHMPSEFHADIFGLLGRNVTFTTSDPGIAMVENGTIFPVKPGSCIITVSDARTSYSIPVEVVYEIPSDYLSASLKSQHAFLYDLTRDLVLYEHGGLDDRISIASLTKLFTGFVASQYLSPDMQIIPGEEIFECPEDGSMAGIEYGVAISVKDLYAGLMLRSGNDCATVMAVSAGRVIANDPSLPFSEAIPVFMNEVNRQAQLYGLTGSHFVTPDGYDADDHYSTMRDMVKISALAYSSPFLQEICSCVSYPVTFANGDSYVWDSFVDMLFKESPFYCPYVNGMKTGSTTNAGRCAITSVVYENAVYLIGTFGCWDGDDRFIDTLILLNDFVFSND